MPRPGDRVRLRLTPVQRHAAFDETVTGLHHLSFRLADIEELDDWAQRLQHWKVEYSQPTDSTLRPGEKVLVFRDPDIIQLELYALPT